MISVRDLTRKDFYTLVDIIKKFVVASGDGQIMKLFKASKEVASQSSEEQSLPNYEVMIPLFIELLEQAIKLLNSEVVEWFADLCGLSVEEYQNEVFDIDVQVVNMIIKQESFPRFFSLASELFKNQRLFKAK